MAPAVGLEPTTDRLTADCSTTELRWNNEIVFITTKTKLQVLFLKKIIFLSFYVKIQKAPIKIGTFKRL